MSCHSINANSSSEAREESSSFGRRPHRKAKPEALNGIRRGLDSIANHVQVTFNCNYLHANRGILVTLPNQSHFFALGKPLERGILMLTLFFLREWKPHIVT